MNVKAGWSMLTETYSDWSEDKAARLGAALSYYTAFSLAPLLVIAIGIAGLAFGEEAAQGLVQQQLQGLVGNEGAAAIQGMVQSARKPASGVLAIAIGFVMLLFGASGVFGQLQDSLNTIWGVQPRPDRGWKGYFKDRFFSFALVLGTGFLLMVSLIVSAGLAAFGKFLGDAFPVMTTVLPVVNFLISLVVITVLFALIFKILPDAMVQWRDVWIGAGATAMFFVIGKTLLGLYLGRGSFSSSYGAAGSVLVVLLWVYYASQILFFGAEFTKVYSQRYGSKIRPSENAVPVSPEARAEQGLDPQRRQGAA